MFEWPARSFLTAKYFTQVSLAFYKMDIELLFSTSPFAFGDDPSSSGSSSSGGGSTYSLFSSVRPNATLSGLALPADGSPLEVALPTSVAGADVMVECKSGSGLRQQVVHNSCEFRLTVHSTMGMARVTRKDTNRPLSGAYVKVEYSSVAGVVFDVWPATHAALVVDFLRSTTAAVLPTRASSTRTGEACGCSS